MSRELPISARPNPTGQPVLLIVDPASSRREYLTRELTSDDVVLVPVAEGHRLRRWVDSLMPDIAIVFGDPSSLGDYSGDHGDEPSPWIFVVDEVEGPVPEACFRVPLDLRSPHHLLQILQLALISRRVGAQLDPRLTSAAGDLRGRTLMEVTRALHDFRYSGSLVCDEGWIDFDSGEVTAAACGTALGAKGFLRLSSLGHGLYKLKRQGWEERTDRHEVRTSLIELVVQAVDEAPLAKVDRRLQYQIGHAAEVGSVPTRLQRRILSLLRSSGGEMRLQPILDELSDVLDGQILVALEELAETGWVTRNSPRTQVRIATDSASDLPPSLTGEMSIVQIPARVDLGNEVVEDPGTFDGHKIWSGAASSVARSLPAETREIELRFRDLLDEGDVLSIHVSEKLSETMGRARRAAARLARQGSQSKLRVVDSGAVSLGLGLLTLCAARLAQKGWSVDSIERRIGELVPRLHLYFVVADLEPVIRGGRIGRLQALVGGLFGLRPMLRLKDGEIVFVEAVRRGRSGVERLISTLVQSVKPSTPVLAFVGHAEAPAEAIAISEGLEAGLPVVEQIRSEIGATVGCHVGVGAIGAAVLELADDEIALFAPVD